MKQKDLEENQDQFKKRIRPFKKLNFKVYVLDFKENIDEIIKRIEDDNLEYTLRKYQNYPTEFIKENRKSSLLLDMGLDKTVIGLMAIKDLFFDAFAISKVLIIVPLRVARYTWKEEIEGLSHPDILKYSVLIGSEEERIKGVDIFPRTRLS